MFYQILLGFTEFYWVLPSYTGFYLVLLGFARFYWVLLGFTGLLWAVAKFSIVLPSCTEFRQLLPDSSGFDRVRPLLSLFFERLERIERVMLVVSKRPGHSIRMDAIGSAIDDALGVGGGVAWGGGGEASLE